MSGSGRPPLTAGDRAYVAKVMKAPMLEREEERALARRWRDRGDEAALSRLVTSHVRLSVRFAMRFRGYGHSVGDLMQEGNAGLLEAARRFDPELGVRFSTYAAWWVLSAMQEFVVRNHSIVRVGTTPRQKRLFFNLPRIRARLTGNSQRRMTDEDRRTIADTLHVPLDSVERMEALFSAPDRSLNTPVGEGESMELLDLLPDDAETPDVEVARMIDGETRSRWLHEAMKHLTPRERMIISRRYLDEGKTTLADLGAEFGVTKERARQIQERALAKLRAALSERGAGDMFAG